MTATRLPTNPREFQRAMLFIDGTNLFYRIESKGLVVEQLSLIRLGRSKISPDVPSNSLPQ
jgi:hypothetical protein